MRVIKKPCSIRRCQAAIAFELLTRCNVPEYFFFSRRTSIKSCYDMCAVFGVAHSRPRTHPFSLSFGKLDTHSPGLPARDLSV